MAAGQLDILAVEPFYGGVRRVMLDSLIRGSRHRWTLLKLPARRMERRLTAAAHWFAEQLSRHWVGHTDLLFTSEALNLSDLNRFVPGLSHVPSVVYFHSNQLPPVSSTTTSPLDLINLNSAAAASEIWFNSKYHHDQFLARATGLVKRYPELASRSPMGELKRKSSIIAPPIDTSAVQAALAASVHAGRDRKTIVVDLRDANIDLLNDAMKLLLRRGETFRLLTLGDSRQLAPEIDREVIDELDEGGQATAMASAGIFLSGRTDALCDHHAIRALSAGCWPLVPAAGYYSELLPTALLHQCEYETDAESLATRLQDVFYLEPPRGLGAQSQITLRNFEPSVACRLIDERLEHLASSNETAVAH